MKKLLTIIILSLCFVTSLQADDIRDFQIEGMSVGDSLLSFYTISNIKNNIKDTSFKKKDYIKVYMKKNDNENINIYDGLQFYIKKKDINFTIRSINGNKFYKNIKDCFKEQNNIYKDFKNLADAKFSSVEKDVHPGLKGAKTHTIYFDFKNGDGGKIACIEPDKELRKQNYKDSLKVTISSKKFREWLRGAF